MRKKHGRMVHGLLVLDKPLGISSNQALQRVKHLFQAKKAGHTGTLDPLATGVLVICLGKSTKVAQHVMEASKVYRVTGKLGVTTSTGDSEGEVLARQAVTARQLERLPEVIHQFIGEIKQVPPMFSALKQDGQPLYKLARQGVEVERKERQVSIYDIHFHGHTEDTFDIEVHCSKGTYIRTLVADIGAQLGCGAHVTVLRRTQVGEFGAGFPMYTLKELEHLAESGMSALDKLKLRTEKAFLHYPKIVLQQGFIDLLQQGSKYKMSGEPDGHQVRIYGTDGSFQGFALVDEANYLQFQRIYDL
jgi:tRNA pseudouridine55 synthase